MAFQDYIVKNQSPLPVQGQTEPLRIASSPIPYKEMNLVPTGVNNMNPNPYSVPQELCDEVYQSDLLVGGHERIWFVLYDAMPFDQSDAATRTQNFFTVALGQQGKTRIDTNLKQSRTLPDPQFFRVHFVACYLVPLEGTNATAEDMMLIANNIILTFWINDKYYLETLSWDMPGGGGQRIHSDPGDLSTASYVWNGIPDQRTMKLLRVPVVIKKNQSFYWTAEVDPTAWDALTQDFKVYWYVTMHGELFRQIQ